MFAGGIAYYNSFSGALVFDDQGSIAENSSIRHFWPLWSVLSPPPEAGGVVGRPFANFTFALNYAMSGPAVWSYHALNLAIHLLAACTLFGLVRRTLLLPILRERFQPAAGPLALTVAVLWTVHPLQTQVVNYLSQRTETLMGLCYLLTLYCFIRGTETNARRWLACSFTACLLGMASKEVMVTAPLMVFLYDRTFVAGTFRDAWRQRRPFYLALAATWVVLGCLMLGLRERGVGYSLGMTAFDYALTECKVVVLYLRLAVWPHPLVFDYGSDLMAHGAEVVPYVLGLGLLLAIILAAMRSRRALGFAGCWVFLILAPASSVVPVAGQPMAESRMYLSLAALIVLAVLGLYVLAGRRSLLVWLVVAPVLGAVTVQRNAAYRSAVSLWSDTVAKRPQNARAHNGLGESLVKAGRPEDAIASFETALQLNPHYPLAETNLGIALAKIHRSAEAIRHFATALQLKPDSAETHYNLAIALLQTNRFEEAIQHLEEASRIKPGYFEAHYILAVALHRAGQLPHAIECYETALRLQPDFEDARQNLERLRAGQPPTAPKI